MKRVFVAINLPDEVKEEIGDKIRDIDSKEIRIIPSRKTREFYRV